MKPFTTTATSTANLSNATLCNDNPFIPRTSFDTPPLLCRSSATGTAGQQERRLPYTFQTIPCHSLLFARAAPSTGGKGDRRTEYHIRAPWKYASPCGANILRLQTIKERTKKPVEKSVVGCYCKHNNRRKAIRWTV